MNMVYIFIWVTSSVGIRAAAERMASQRASWRREPSIGGMLSLDICRVNMILGSKNLIWEWEKADFH